MLINKFLKKLPPTRGIRYKDSFHNLVIKNSFKTPATYKISPSYVTFTVVWDEGMTRCKYIDTTPNSNVRLKRLYNP